MYCIIVDSSRCYRSNYNHVTGVEYFHLLPKHVTRGWQIIGQKKWRDSNNRVTSQCCDDSRPERGRYADRRLCPKTDCSSRGR